MNCFKRIFLAIFLMALTISAGCGGGGGSNNPNNDNTVNPRFHTKAEELSYILSYRPTIPPV